MTKISFRRIAISNFNFTQSVVEAAVLRWVECALKKQADVLLIREALSLEQLEYLLEIIHRFYSTRTFSLLVHSQWKTTWNIDGVHFKESDPRTTTTSKSEFSEKIVLGKSCHSIEVMQHCEEVGFDYVFFSSIFQSRTHPAEILQGMEKLRLAAQAVQLPVFALGGIDSEEKIQRCRAAGAHGIAAIDFFSAQ